MTFEGNGFFGRGSLLMFVVERSPLDDPLGTSSWKTTGRIPNHAAKLHVVVRAVWCALPWEQQLLTTIEC